MDILVAAPVMPGGDNLAVVLPVKSGRPKVNQAHLIFIQFSFLCFPNFFLLILLAPTGALREAII